MKTCGSLWQYYRDAAALDNNNKIINYPPNNNSIAFKFKEKITGQRGSDGTKHVKVMPPLKYLSNFWTTFEVSLIVKLI